MVNIQVGDTATVVLNDYLVVIIEPLEIKSNIIFQ